MNLLPRTKLHMAEPTLKPRFEYLDDLVDKSNFAAKGGTTGLSEGIIWEATDNRESYGMPWY